jgi:polyribonucleotide nucleotidyltransferase
MRIPNQVVGYIIGKQGANIKKIITDYNVSINISQEDNKISIFAYSQDSLKKTIDAINQSGIKSMVNLKNIQVNDSYDGVIVKLLPRGAFIKLNDDVDGFISLINLQQQYSNPQEGDIIKVKVQFIDKFGKVKLVLQ